MSAPIEFYFDFSSPYSYLASEQIEPLAARYGRTIDYRPVLLGAAFKASGMLPLVDIPLKGEYSKRDFDRSARFAGLQFVLPQPFPIGAVGASRAYLWLRDSDRERAHAFLHAAFRAYFSAEFRRPASSPAFKARATFAGEPSTNEPGGICIL